MIDQLFEVLGVEDHQPWYVQGLQLWSYVIGSVIVIAIAAYFIYYAISAVFGASIGLASVIMSVIAIPACMALCKWNEHVEDRELNDA